MAEKWHVSCSAWRGTPQHRLEDWMQQQLLPFLRLDKRAHAPWAFIEFASAAQREAYAEKLKTVLYKKEGIYLRAARPKPEAQPLSVVGAAASPPQRGSPYQRSSAGSQRSSSNGRTNRSRSKDSIADSSLCSTYGDSSSQSASNMEENEDLPTGGICRPKRRADDDDHGARDSLSLCQRKRSAQDSRRNESIDEKEDSMSETGERSNIFVNSSSGRYSSGTNLSHSSKQSAGTHGVSDGGTTSYYVKDNSNSKNVGEMLGCVKRGAGKKRRGKTISYENVNIQEYNEDAEVQHQEDLLNRIGFAAPPLPSLMELQQKHKKSLWWRSAVRPISDDGPSGALEASARASTTPLIGFSYFDQLEIKRRYFMTCMRKMTKAVYLAAQSMQTPLHSTCTSTTPYTYHKSNINNFSSPFFPTLSDSSSTTTSSSASSSPTSSSSSSSLSTFSPASFSSSSSSSFSSSPSSSSFSSSSLCSHCASSPLPHVSATTASTTSVVGKEGEVHLRNGPVPSCCCSSSSTEGDGPTNILRDTASSYNVDILQSQHSEHTTVPLRGPHHEATPCGHRGSTIAATGSYPMESLTKNGEAPRGEPTAAAKATTAKETAAEDASAADEVTATGEATEGTATPLTKEDMRRNAAATQTSDSIVGGVTRDTVPESEVPHSEYKSTLPWYHPLTAKRWEGFKVIPPIGSVATGRVGYRNKCEFTIGYTHAVEDDYDEKLHQRLRLFDGLARMQSVLPQLQQLVIDTEEPCSTVLQHEPRHCLVASLASHVSTSSFEPFKNALQHGASDREHTMPSFPSPFSSALMAPSCFCGSDLTAASTSPLLSKVSHQKALCSESSTTGSRDSSRSDVIADVQETSGGISGNGTGHVNSAGVGTTTSSTSGNCSTERCEKLLGEVEEEDIIEPPNAKGGDLNACRNMSNNSINKECISGSSNKQPPPMLDTATGEPLLQPPPPAASTLDEGMFCDNSRLSRSKSVEQLSPEMQQKYRNNKARVCVGFVKRVDHLQPLVAPVSGSLTVSHAMQEICTELQVIINRSRFPVYNRRTRRGVWRLMVVRAAELKKELMVLVQIKRFDAEKALFHQYTRRDHSNTGPSRCSRDSRRDGDSSGAEEPRRRFNGGTTDSRARTFGEAVGQGQGYRQENSNTSGSNNSNSKSSTANSDSSNSSSSSSSRSGKKSRSSSDSPRRREWVCSVCHAVSSDMRSVRAAAVDADAAKKVKMEPARAAVAARMNVATIPAAVAVTNTTPAAVKNAGAPATADTTTGEQTERNAANAEDNRSSQLLMIGQKTPLSSAGAVGQGHHQEHHPHDSQTDAATKINTDELHISRVDMEAPTQKDITEEKSERKENPTETQQLMRPREDKCCCWNVCASALVEGLAGRIFDGYRVTSLFLQELWGEAYITHRVLGLDFRVGPHTFFQTNTGTCPRLFRTALELVLPLPSSKEIPIIDVCCGTGTLALCAAAAMREQRQQQEQQLQQQRQQRTRPLLTVKDEKEWRKEQQQQHRQQQQKMHAHVDKTMEKEEEEQQRQWQQKHSTSLLMKKEEQQQLEQQQQDEERKQQGEDTGVIIESVGWDEAGGRERQQQEQQLEEGAVPARVRKKKKIGERELHDEEKYNTMTDHQIDNSTVKSPMTDVKSALEITVAKEAHSGVSTAEEHWESTDEDAKEHPETGMHDKERRDGAFSAVDSNNNEREEVVVVVAGKEEGAVQEMNEGRIDEQEKTTKEGEKREGKEEKKEKEEGEDRVQEQHINEKGGKKHRKEGDEEEREDGKGRGREGGEEKKNECGKKERTHTGADQYGEQDENKDDDDDDERKTEGNSTNVKEGNKNKGGGSCVLLRPPRVLGIEVVEEAVQHARANAELNGLQSEATFVCGSAEDVLRGLFEEKYKNIEEVAAIVDPPRAGLRRWWSFIFERALLSTTDHR